MKRLYILIVFTAMVVSLGAQTIQDKRFEAANALYNKGERESYEAALATYDSIIADKYVSAALLYNIGNTYFKLNNYPMAILNYEKALKLDPTNADIKKNLEITNSLLTDKIEPVPEHFIKRWINSIGNMFSANGWAILSLVLFGILVILIFLYITAGTKLLKEVSFFGGILVILLFVCSIIFANRSVNILNQHNEAIITESTTTVKSAPSESGTDIFVLHSGTKVTILDKEGDWDRIKIADGRDGWLPSSSSIKY